MDAAVGLPPSELLGREEERAVLEQALSNAENGFGGLFVISAEAGMGKSALVDDTARSARRLGFSVAIGRAWEFADAPPLYPLRPFLRSLDLEPGSILDGAQGMFSVWEGILEALVRGSAHVPQFWALEDLHCADEQTFDALLFLARPLRALRSVMLVTTRPLDQRLDPTSLDKIARLCREGQELTLAPLGGTEVAALARALAKRPLARSVLEKIVELSAGNPLFVGELTRALGAHGSELPETLPITLRHWILERARDLPSATRRTLDAASVLGRDFSAVLVARMLDVQPARVIDDLLPSLRAGILFQLEPGVFRFSHALVRDAFYDQLGPGQRSSLHYRAALGPPTALEPTDNLFSSAQHALKGLPHAPSDFVSSLVDRAVSLLIASRAFDRAYGLRKQEEAAIANGLLPARTPVERLASARLGRDAGRFAEASATCRAVLIQARMDGDPELFARAALELGAALRPGVVDPALVEALMEAERSLSSSSAGLRVLVRARLAAALQPAADPTGPVQCAIEAIEAARPLGDTAVLREVLFYAGSALVDFAPADVRVQCAEELYQLSVSTGEHARALHATVRLALEHSTQGDFVAFGRDVDRALELSERLQREPRYRWRPLLLASMRASAHGRFVESERFIVEAEQLRAICDDPALETTLRCHQLMTLHLQRRDEEVDQKLVEVAELLGEMPIGRTLLGLLRLHIHACRDQLEPSRELWALTEPQLESLRRDPDFIALLGDGAVLCGSAGARRELLGHLSRGCPEFSMGHMFMVYEGPAARVSGLLSASLGERDQAIRELLGAVERAHHRGHRPWEARMHYDLGRVLCSLDEQDQGTRHLQTAFELARSLGVDGLADEAGRLLGRQRTEPPASARPAQRFSLKDQGDFYQVVYEGRTYSVRGTRGLQLLAKLVDRPDEEIHVLALSGDDDAATGEATEGGVGGFLDQKALQTYRARLVDIDRELGEAEADADRARLERLAGERAALLAELSRAVGLGGRVRTAGSATERARVNVQKRLKQAISHLGEVDRELGVWLGKAVRTGAFCSFRR